MSFTDRATSDKLEEEDWQSIMNICDKAGKSSEDAKAWLRAIVKRLYNSDPHVGVKAVTVSSTFSLHKKLILLFF